MRAWQKIVLALLSITAIAAIGGAGSVYLGVWQPAAAPGAVLATPTLPAPVAQLDAPEQPAPTSEARILPLAAASVTPFQPVPYTATPSATPTPTQTPTPLPTNTPTPTATPAFPAETFIDGIWGYPQTYNLSCESRSASDLARYFGVHFTELEFLWALPSSDNPDVGFVGDVTGYLGQLPPLGYGVHAWPVAELMRSFGLEATAHRGLTLKQLKTELGANRPVMIWAVRDLGYSDPVEYEAADGQTVTVARFEHTFIVIGYGPGYITVLDNQRVYSVPTEQFLDSWGVLGNMAITVSDG